MNPDFPGIDRVPDLSRIGEQFDPTVIPPIFTGTLHVINWDTFLDYDNDNPENSVARLRLYFPLLPFFKFDIPLALPNNQQGGILKLIADLQRVWDYYQGMKNANEETTTPVEGLHSLSGEPPENME
jgi:hypothetical protein